MRYLLDKFAHDLAPEYVFSIMPELKRIVSSQALGQIGHAFCLVGLCKLARTECRHSVREEVIKV